MNRPELSWFPVRYLVDEVAGRGVGLAWLDQATNFGFSYVEIHEIYIRTPEQEAELRKRLETLRLRVSQVTCAPDFVHPDTGARQQEFEAMRDKVAAAARVGAPNVRVTAGIAREQVPAADALRWVTELLVNLADEATALGVMLCLENHFRDRSWPSDATDFTFYSNHFSSLVDELRTSPVRVNFDTAQTMLTGADPVELLAEVEDRVANFHAGDRIRGERQHAVIGDGDVDFDGVLQRLSHRAYDGFVTVEDGSAFGDDGLRRSIAYLDEKISRWWAG